MSHEGLSVEIDLAPMREIDLDEVLRIERASFSSPWSRKMFQAEFAATPFSFSWVVRAKGETRIIGYLCFWVVFDEVHLVNLAIDPEYRRKGVGEETVRRALKLGQAPGGRTAYLEVRVSNHAAVNLYKKIGFAQYGVRRDYYTDPKEDALLLSLRYSGGHHEERHGPAADPKEQP